MSRAPSPIVLPPAKRIPKLVSEYLTPPDTLFTFEFDTYDIDESFLLKNIVGHIFLRMMQDTDWRGGGEIGSTSSSSSSNICGLASPEHHGTLATFIHLVCNHYRNNPYHNFQHAVNVLHSTYILLHRAHYLPRIPPAFVFATLIAALCHDVDHPGNTNSYEIHSNSALAMLYNDNSVLENHHCHLTFTLLEQSGLKNVLLNTVGVDGYRACRQVIIACILGTDMSKHSELLRTFEAATALVPAAAAAAPAVGAGANDIRDDSDDGEEKGGSVFGTEEAVLLLKCVVHFADLSNGTKHFEAVHFWSTKISEEFWIQSLHEEQLGLPSLSFMKARDPLSMCVNELMFLRNHVLPMWEGWVRKCPDMHFLVEAIQRNIREWEALEQDYRHTHEIHSLTF